VFTDYYRPHVSRLSRKTMTDDIQRRINVFKTGENEGSYGSITLTQHESCMVGEKPRLVMISIRDLYKLGVCSGLKVRRRPACNKSYLRKWRNSC